jgi:hypothetical protein
MTLRRKGDKNKYSFVDLGCLGRGCFAPGMYQHRSPLSCGGSRNTGSPDSPCCLNRAYHGCPSGPVGETIEKEPSGREITRAGLPVIDEQLMRTRKKDGWRRG